MIGDIAAVIAAVAFALLVIFLAVPLWKLGSVFAQLEKSIKELSNETQETIKQGQDSINQINAQLERVDSISAAASRSAEDISALTTLVTATLGKPLIKVAAFSYAVRQAMGLNKTKQEQQ